MARGKHGARAANRLAHTENELLIEKTAECNRLENELRDLQADYNSLTSDFRAASLRRASEIAEAEVSAARQQTSQIQQQFDTYRDAVGIDCWRLYQDYGCTLGEDKDHKDYAIYFQKYVAIFNLSKQGQAELRRISDPEYKVNRISKRMADKSKGVDDFQKQLSHNPALPIELRANRYE